MTQRAKAEELREYYVVKANDLIRKGRYNLTTQQQKIVLFAISKIRKNDEEKFSMPLLVLIVLMFAFWITIPLLIIGMFCGYKYRFEGMETVSVNLNDLSDRASLEIEALKRKYDAQ